MATVPPIAPDRTGDEGFPLKVAEPAGEGGKTSISCAAHDCQYNASGKCSKDTINVSAGPTARCTDYEPSGGGKAALPRPPLPMQMGMGA